MLEAYLGRAFKKLIVNLNLAKIGQVVRVGVEGMCISQHVAREDWDNQ